MADLLVLCYHGVSSRWPTPVALAPERLRAQLRRLLAAGYEPATLSAALAAPPGARRLAVTFDDALCSVRTGALPVLDALGMPATIFACTGWVGRAEPMRIGYDRWLGTEHEHELRSLGWGELGELRARGWEIGSHTRTHPRLPELDDGALARELRESREAIERRLEAPCRALAYPHGACDGRVAAAAAAAGYELACTATAGIAATDPLRVPRVVVLREDGPARFALKTGRVARRARAAGAWRLLGPAYRALGGGRGHRGPA